MIVRVSVKTALIKAYDFWQENLMRICTIDSLLNGSQAASLSTCSSSALKLKIG